MTKKYDAFLLELKQLCEKHNVKFMPKHDEILIVDNCTTYFELDELFEDKTTDS